MNFIGMLKRGDKLDKAFEDLQTGMLDVLEEDLLSLDDISARDNLAEADADHHDETASEGSASPVANAAHAQGENDAEARRITAHAQSRLASLASFEEMYRGAEVHLQDVSARLSDVMTTHHLMREFLGNVQTDIHRANELEIVNTALAAEKRKLTEQVSEAVKKQQDQEGTLEISQRRELGLLQDRDTLRVALSAARLELVEAGNALARSEADRGEVVKALATRTVEAERRLRENEMLREKHVNLSIDLDQSLKREAETRRKFDELSAVHTQEMNVFGELQATQAKNEKELTRLAKQLEAVQAKNAEMVETIRGLEADTDSENNRHLAETRGLRTEIQGLHAHAETATNELVESANEIAKLKVLLGDATSDKQVAEEKLNNLRKEVELERRSLATANASLSQITLQQASDQMQIDVHKQDAEELRGEVADLTEQVRRLSTYEALHNMDKSRDAARLRNRADEPKAPLPAKAAAEKREDAKN